MLFIGHLRRTWRGQALPPEEWGRDGGAGDFLARDFPEFANLRPHLRGFAAEHLEHESGIVRQPAGAERHALLQVDLGADPRVNALGLVRRRAQDDVAEHLEAVHHARLPHRVAQGLHHQLFAEQRLPAGPHGHGRQRQQRRAEALVRVMVPATRLHDLGAEHRRGRVDGDPGLAREPRLAVRDQRIGEVLEIRALAELEGLRLLRVVGVHRVDLGRRLRGDVRSRARSERHVERQPIALQHAARRGDHEQPRHVRERVVAMQRALRKAGRARLEIGQDRASVPALEAQAQAAGLADGAAPHLRRLVAVTPRTRPARRAPRPHPGVRASAPARPRPLRSLPRRQLEVEQQVVADQLDEFGNALAGAAVGEQERLVAAHQLRIVRHHLEARADVGRQVGLVDDEDVRLRDPGSVLARDLVAGGDVDHVDEEVDQRRREGQRQVVAAALDQHDVAVGKARLHVLDRREVHAGILAHRRVRTGAGLDAEDAFLEQDALQRALDVLGVLGRHHVVGDDEDLDAHLEQRRRDGLDDRRLARADGAADPDSRYLLHVALSPVEPLQFMNRRTCALTWTAARISASGANPAMSSRPAPAAIAYASSASALSA